MLRRFSIRRTIQHKVFWKSENECKIETQISSCFSFVSVSWLLQLVDGYIFLIFIQKLRLEKITLLFLKVISILHKILIEALIFNIKRLENLQQDTSKQRIPSLR